MRSSSLWGWNHSGEVMLGTNDAWHRAGEPNKAGGSVSLCGRAAVTLSGSIDVCSGSVLLNLCCKALFEIRLKVAEGISDLLQRVEQRGVESPDLSVQVAALAALGNNGTPRNGACASSWRSCRETGGSPALARLGASSCLVSLPLSASRSMESVSLHYRTLTEPRLRICATLCIQH